MAHKITLIPGDGIGPEVTHAVVRILEATGVKFEWERYAAGAEAFEIHGEYIPAALYESIERNRVALKGPVTTPIGGGFKSINVTLCVLVSAMAFASFPVVPIYFLSLLAPWLASSSSSSSLNSRTSLKSR